MALWLAGTIALFVAFDAWLGPLLAAMSLLPWLISTAGLLVACATLGVLRLSKGALAMMPAILIAVVGVFALSDGFSDVGVRLRFWMERPGYEAAVAAMQAGRPIEAGLLAPGTRAFLVTEPGTPRLGFDWGGVADNWAGVVYDPTDVVSTAHGWGKRPGDFTASPESQKVFGGDLVGCIRLSGHYYHCAFT